jgi:hypothetical protein
MGRQKTLEAVLESIKEWVGTTRRIVWVCVHISSAQFRVKWQYEEDTDGSNAVEVSFTLKLRAG